MGYTFLKMLFFPYSLFSWKDSAARRNKQVFMGDFDAALGAGGVVQGAAGDGANAQGGVPAPVVGRYAQYNARHDKKRILQDRRQDPLVKKGDAAVNRGKKPWHRGMFNVALTIKVPGMPVGLRAQEDSPVTLYNADEGTWVQGKFRRIVFVREEKCPDFVVAVIPPRVGEQGATVIASPVELARAGHFEIE